MRLMRRTFVLLLALVLAAPAEQKERAAAAPSVAEPVHYIGGTLPGVKPGVDGTLDLSVPEALVFASGDARIEIPYKNIQKYEYSRRLARRIGIIATIAVVAVAKRRQRRHFFTITYRDTAGNAQMIMIEVAKTLPPILQGVLEARSALTNARKYWPHEALTEH